MTADKAIEILSSNGLCPEQTTWGDYLHAVKLGREALELIKDIRARFPTLIPDPLPGEDPK